MSNSRKRFQVSADTTLGVLFCTLTVGRNVKEQTPGDETARAAISKVHGLPIDEITEVIEIRELEPVAV